MYSRVWLTITISFVLSLLMACGPAAPTVAPTKPPAAPAIESKPAAATAMPLPTPTAAPKVKRGGTLTFASNADWQSADPHTAMSSAFGMNHMYSSLLWYVYNDSAQKFEFVPALATSWEVNPKSATFRLRKDVMFHDGTPFNAEVAKWNIDRMRTHKESLIKIDIPNVSSVDVVDDYTIRLNLSAPPAGLLEMLSDANAAKPMFLSKAYAEQVGDQVLRTKPIGTGPFKLIEWRTADRMIFERWDKYWETGEDGKLLPYLDRVVMRVIPEQTTKPLEMKTGNLQGIYAPDPKDVAGLKADPKLHVFTLPWKSDVGYGFYSMRDPLWRDNQKLRQALLYAIDRKSIADILGYGTAQPAYWHWGKGMIGYDESVPYYDYQPDRAKQLLAEAGLDKGFDIVLYGRVSGQDLKVQQMVQSMWGKLGVRSDLQSMQNVAYNAAMRAGQIQVGVSSKSLGELDPRNLDFRFKSDGPKNFALTENPELDKCLDEGVSTDDPKKRHETYVRCQRLVYDEAAFWLTWQWPYTIAIDKDLKGWLPTYGGEFLRLERAWLDK